MSHCVAHLIGIRVGGVFDGDAPMDRVGKIIEEVIEESKLAGERLPYDFSLERYHCLSLELNGRKGTMVAIGGVFNNWFPDEAAMFARRLSKSFGTDVMVSSHDLETNETGSSFFAKGYALNESPESTISELMRRI